MSGKSMATTAVLVGAALAAGPARAELITFEFAGQIDYVYDPDGVWDGQLHAGSPFSGSYTFDSEAQPWGGEPGAVFYDLTDITASLAGETFSSLGTNAYRSIIYVANLTNDDYGPSASGFQSGRFYVGGLGIMLRDWTGQALVSTDLPLVAPDLSLFQVKLFSMGGQDQTLGEFEVRGTLTSLPEPSLTFLLLLVGGLCLSRRS